MDEMKRQMMETPKTVGRINHVYIDGLKQRIKELEAQINKVINDNHSMQVALDDLALEKQTGSKSSFANRGLGDTKEACGNYLLDRKSVV